MTLGEQLKRARLAQKKSLRDVEATTGISNGYLSQLESDTVRQPSPHHLHQLASDYGLAYGRLMQLAGYVTEGIVAARAEGPAESAILGLEELTAEDRRKIQEYVDDLRDARRARAS